MDTSGLSPLPPLARSFVLTNSPAARWISGAGDPRNAVHLVMGKSDTSASKHQQQSIVIVPANAKGVHLIRPMQVVRAFLPPAPEEFFASLHTIEAELPSLNSLATMMPVRALDCHYFSALPPANLATSSQPRATSKLSTTTFESPSPTLSEAGAEALR